MLVSWYSSTLYIGNTLNDGKLLQHFEVKQQQVRPLQLPDQYGNSLINAWLASNGRPTDSLNPVELLCFIGQRGMGALEFEQVHAALVWKK